MQKFKRAALTAAAVLSLAGTAAACGPDAPPPIPPAYAVQVDLAPNIPPQCGCSNYASIIRTKAENFGYPAGTTMRVDHTDLVFIGGHGGYEMLVEFA